MKLQYQGKEYIEEKKKNRKKSQFLEQFVIPPDKHELLEHRVAETAPLVSQNLLPHREKSLNSGARWNACVVLDEEVAQDWLAQERCLTGIILGWQA